MSLDDWLSEIKRFHLIGEEAEARLIRQELLISGLLQRGGGDTAHAQRLLALLGDGLELMRLRQAQRFDRGQTRQWVRSREST